MAPINSLTWTAFYDQHRKDGGVIQSLFDREVREFAEVTTSHFQNPNGLAQTIGCSAYANVVIVPGEKGRVNILHHGFTCNTRDGFSLIFIQGNHSDCAYFKVLPPIEATNEIKAPTDGSRRTPYINCPSLASMRAVSTADEFAALESQGSTILRKQPNHVIVPPTVFLMVKGENNVLSKELAMVIIARIKVDQTGDDDALIDQKDE